MKQYIKPIATVVELSVKENIAALPNAIQSFADVTQTTVGSQADVILTTYNLAAAQTSNPSQV